jgi:hypothetical protein
MARRQKRRRGGQPGNQNARRHGFYSSSLDQADICRFLNIINSEGVDPVVAVLRLKLSSVLERSPGNRRVILEACKLLAEHYASKYEVSPRDIPELKKYIRNMFSNQPVEISRKGNYPQNQSSVP